MKTILFLRKLRVQWVSVLALTLLAVLGLPRTAYLQAQTCRDVNQLTICADEFFDMTTNGGGFALRGNIKIGPKGGAAVVQVGDTGSVFDGTILPGSITNATYFHFNQTDPNTGTTDFLKRPSSQALAARFWLCTAY